MRFMVNGDVVAVSGSSNAFAFDADCSFKGGRDFDIVSEAVDVNGFDSVDIAEGQCYVMNDCFTSAGQTVEAIIGMSDGNFVVVTRTDECHYEKNDVICHVSAVYMTAEKRFVIDEDYEPMEEAEEKYSAEIAEVMRHLGY